MFDREQDLGLIEHESFDSSGAIIVVNERLWSGLSYDAREQSAVAFDCLIAGDGNHISSIHFRRTTHGDDLDRFDAIDLLKARASYFGPGSPQDQSKS